jgi:CheY-like chemotaxis protein
VLGILYQFDSFESLADRLHAEAHERELALPEPVELRDGEWVLATLRVADDCAAIAARAVDRGDGIRLSFTDRDWERLLEFAMRSGPPSVPPLSVRSQALAVPADTEVLVVDDDEDVRCIVKSVLCASGFRVESVSTAEEALDHLMRARVDLVVLDSSLPGMSGVELVRLLRRDPGLGALPVLFLSSHCSSADVATAFDAGADDFVGKPFRARELGARILGLLSRSRPLEPRVAG